MYEHFDTVYTKSKDTLTNAYTIIIIIIAIAAVDANRVSYLLRKRCSEWIVIDSIFLSKFT